METFTKPKPEGLEWLSPAKRSRQLRGWSGMGPTEWSTVAQIQEPSLRALDSFISSIHCPLLASHMPCLQASTTLGWQSMGHHSNPVVPQDTV